MKKIIGTICFTLTALTIHGQFAIEVELRPRGECRYGYKELPDSGDVPAYFVSQRSRLNVHYNSDKYTMKFSVQDVRVWGDESIYSSTGVIGDAASIDMHEAWVSFKTGSISAIKIGRQEIGINDQRLIINDQRLISKRNWNQHGVSYNAITYTLNHPAVKVDMALSLNNAKENTMGNLYTPDKIKTLNFINLHRRFSDYLEISALGILTGNTKSADKEKIYYMSTYGPTVKITKTPLCLNGYFYYQTGHNKYGKEIEAYLAHSRISYTVEKLVFSCGYDYLSGTKSGSMNDHSFNPLYGTRHGFYGEMDIFSDFSKDTKGAGLVDMYPTVQYTINAQHTLELPLFSDSRRN